MYNLLMISLDIPGGTLVGFTIAIAVTMAMFRINTTITEQQLRREGPPPSTAVLVLMRPPRGHLPLFIGRSPQGTFTSLCPGHHAISTQLRVLHHGPGPSATLRAAPYHGQAIDRVTLDVEDPRTSKYIMAITLQTSQMPPGNPEQ